MKWCKMMFTKLNTSKGHKKNWYDKRLTGSSYCTADVKQERAGFTRAVHHQDLTVKYCCGRGQCTYLFRHNAIKALILEERRGHLTAFLGIKLKTSSSWWPYGHAKKSHRKSLWWKRRQQYVVTIRPYMQDYNEIRKMDNSIFQFLHCTTENTTQTPLCLSNGKRRKRITRFLN